MASSSRAMLTVVCRSAADARDLLSVLSPDNVDIPRGMGFSVDLMERTVQFLIDSAGTAPVATALSILNDVSLFSEVSLLSQEPRPNERGARN